MAEAPAGWLRPEALDSRSVARRALDLLGGFLDDDQRAEVEAHQGFRLERPDRVYWIPLTWSPRCAFWDRSVIEHYCIAPSAKGRMPPADVALTFLLWIQSDPDGFHREANVMRAQPFDPEMTSAELVGLFAFGAGARIRRARRPSPRSPDPYRPTGGLDAQTRALGLARASELTTKLKAEDLRALFARHGHQPNEDVLRKLARR